MKKTAIIALLSLLFILTGCGSEEAEPVKMENEAESVKMKEYSNLTEMQIQNELADIMEQAGISHERREVFFDHVEQFNTSVPAEYLTEGFEEAEITYTKYDPYELQDVWTAANPDFMGYNCRITAYSLMGDYIEASADSEIRDNMVLMDISALEEDGSALLNEGDLESFKALFSMIPTEATKDVDVHVENMQKDWQERGISFKEGTDASLITVLFHEHADENNDYLFVGHAGVLLPAEDGGLLFVEKLAFQEPYQLTKFEDRAELNDYLMTKYDVSEGQPTAAPFVMENDRKML